MTTESHCTCALQIWAMEPWAQCEHCRRAENPPREVHFFLDRFARPRASLDLGNGNRTRAVLLTEQQRQQLRDIVRAIERQLGDEG